MRIDREMSLILLFCISILAIDTYIHLHYEDTEKLPEDALMDNILGIFVKVLATVSALVFAIPLFFNKLQGSTLYSKSDQRYVFSYLVLFLLGIFVSLFTLVRILGPENSFKWCLILFLNCLILLIPYVFIFLTRDTTRLMEKITNSILDELYPPLFFDGKPRKDTAKEKINNLRKITLQALSNQDYVVLDRAIEFFMKIVDEITPKKPEPDSAFVRGIKKVLKRTDIDTEVGNLLVNEIVKSLRDIGIVCIEHEFDEYARERGKHIRKIITDGLKNQKNYNYPLLVLSLRKLGISAARKHIEETVDEILNSLGKIGDQSVGINLQRPPVIAVLKSLESIGIVCAEEKIAHQCATTRNRILGIAGLGKEKEQEDVLHIALRRFWVVTAHFYTNISDKKANYELEKKTKEKFGSIFMRAIDESIVMLRGEGEWMKERVVKDFKNTSTFFIE